MKKLTHLVTEAEENAAHKQAVGMGLKYRGFGYWEDPNSGQVKYKTEGESLVPVEDKPEAELGTKGGPRQPGGQYGQGGGLLGGGLQGMGTGMQMMQPGGQMPIPGQNVGPAPEPGEELPFTTLEWEPGPDGSTCVNSDEPPGEVPEDSYVSRSNNLKWGAGPEGTNYSNIDYETLLKDMRSPNLDSFLNRMERQKMMGKLKEGQMFIDTFMTEAPMQAGMGPRTAADEAKAAGLTYNGYGYWADRQGQVVAKTENGQLKYLQGDQKQPTTATLDMGNPTSDASGQTPADKARSMGLVSNGSGGYVDQEGNVIARTVNNELVFYDSRAGGGAVSDGSGGAQITQSAPSWVDPVTGLIVVPPAQPESPEEINAVPDPVPATAPYGYDSFVNKKKKEMYRQNYIETQANQEIEERRSEMMQAYESTPGSLKLYETLDEKLTAAEQSGDEHRIRTAEIARRKMEEQAERVQQLYSTIPQEKHEELTNRFERKLRLDAKMEARAQERGDDDDGDFRFKDKDGLIQSASVISQVDGDAIDQMEDSAMGLRGPMGIKVPQGGDKRAKFRPVETVSGPRTLEGDTVDYTFTEAEDTMGLAREANRVARKMGIDQRASYDRAPVLDISWEVADGEAYDDAENKKKMSAADRKRAALEALKMWRKDILPTLTPGTIVRAEPMLSDEEKKLGTAKAGNQRERIYQLAGFGPSTYGEQHGFVIVDEEGNKKVVPLFAKDEDKTRNIDEHYLAMNDLDLNTLESQVVYEMLFS